jgi:hypothetical protein
MKTANIHNHLDADMQKVSLGKAFPACDKSWIPTIMDHSNFGAQPSSSFRGAAVFQTFFALGWLKQPARNLKAIFTFPFAGCFGDLEIVG